MTGKQAGDAALKERIEQAALSVFAEKGYRGATMAQIAAQAAVNPATVYRFFRGKRALFDSLQRPDLDFPDQQEQAARRSILRTALTLFSQKGYAFTTMDEIAEAVGLSKAGIYVYFSSKEALFLAVLEKPASFDMIQSTVARCLSDPNADFEAGLAQLTRTYLSFFEEEDFVSLLRILLSEGARSPTIARGFRENIVQQGSQLVAGYLQRFCDLERAQLETKARMLFGMLFSWGIANLFLGDDTPQAYDLDRVAREHVQQFLYGIQASIQAHVHQEHQ